MTVESYLFSFITVFKFATFLLNMVQTLYFHVKTGRLYKIQYCKIMTQLIIKKIIIM